MAIYRSLSDLTPKTLIGVATVTFALGDGLTVVETGIALH